MVSQDIITEESKEFYRNCLGKITSPVNLDEIQGNEYRGFIVCNMPGLMGTFNSQPLAIKLSPIVKQLYFECKSAIFSGYGIVASFECKDPNHS